MTWIRSVVLTTFVIVSIPVYATFVLLAAPFGRKAAYRGVTGWARLVMWSCRFFCNLDFVVEGRENIPAEPSVVFLKHSSAWETLAEALVFPPQTWVLKRELMWVPFFGWALHTLKPIAINRRAGRSAVEQVVAQGKIRLHDDKLWVMIFPEGTRMPPGQTKRYGRSGALLAREASVKIVPVAHNAADFWPRRGWQKKPGTIRFVIGPTIEPGQRPSEEINTEVQEWIEGTMREISSGYPAVSAG